MKCPIDNALLSISDKQGIEIDYCPECRGVWLDRGELDKLIERSSASEPISRSRDSYIQDNERYDDDYKDRRYDQPTPHKRKKEGFLGELFDF